jgi:hypothetical protein
LALHHYPCTIGSKIERYFSVFLLHRLETINHWPRPSYWIAQRKQEPWRYLRPVLQSRRSVLNELGYLPFAQSGQLLLFHLISRLYLCRKAEIVSADRTARIGQNMHDKELILSLLTTLFRAVSLQRVIKRATPYRTGSHRRSIINAFGESPP